MGGLLLCCGWVFGCLWNGLKRCLLDMVHAGVDMCLCVLLVSHFAYSLPYVLGVGMCFCVLRRSRVLFVEAIVK